MFIEEAIVKKLYTSFEKKHAFFRQKLKRPLTYAEKVLFSHLGNPSQSLERGKDYVDTLPDRVAMQDATAQMATLQFMLAGKKKVEVPTTIHCDHLIQARIGASKDLQKAMLDNDEVYNFLQSAAQKYGMGFWKPGAGIIHQVILENYAFPGGMMIGTDSHTPNAGGLGMLAIGVGGADAMDVMVGMEWNVKLPKIIGVRLSGKLQGWTSPKDVILKLAGILKVDGGTGHIIEYFGPGTASISCTGKGTITNMGAELGATTSIFPFDERMAIYLEATGRKPIAQMSRKHAKYLRADPEVEKNPKKFYDKIIEIDLNKLEPHVVGPHTPDLARPISKLASDVKKQKYPEKLSYALIGSCTNSSYEDLGRAAHIARQAADAGLKAKCGFMITPGSAQIDATIRRDKIMDTFEKIGGVVLANACGPCIGQWKRDDNPGDKPNSIITSFNRNFKRRNDGSANTNAFIASPEIVTAIALAGDLKFNPLKDKIDQIKLKAPMADELPKKGFAKDDSGYLPPAKDGSKLQVKVNQNSDRLQLLNPFNTWDLKKDFSNLFVLVKAKGKCTTDHISPAGVWLKYRGHLDNISNNMFSGAINAFTDKEGKGKDQLDKKEKRFSDIARHYKQEKRGWIAVGDTNYGEGSSREHAAMELRHLGCRAVISRSFARIAETNLKKQGILPLWFVNTGDYDKIHEDDVISLEGLEKIAPDMKLNLAVMHKDGKVEKLLVKHSFSREQLKWFRAGSALNKIREEKK